MSTTPMRYTVEPTYNADGSLVTNKEFAKNLDPLIFAALLAGLVASKQKIRGTVLIKNRTNMGLSDAKKCYELIESGAPVFELFNLLDSVRFSAVHSNN